MPFPDFLCIGAQKSGTTWLYHQLKQHPQVWLPPVKELHYFDRQEKKPLIANVFSLSLRGQFVRSSLRLLFKSGHTAWYMRFVGSKRDEKHYAKLFSPEAQQVGGEITPAYARLEESQILRIKQLMPDIKLIYLLRSPVDRAWSQMNMFKRRKPASTAISYQEIYELKKVRLIEHSKYTENLKRWTKYFDSSQIFIGFYEQINVAPLQLMQDIYRFLGIGQDLDGLDKNVSKAYNQGRHGSIPLEIEKTLTLQLITETELLNQRFGNGYTKLWLERANQVLSTD